MIKEIMKIIDERIIELSRKIDKREINQNIAGISINELENLKDILRDNYRHLLKDSQNRRKEKSK